MLAVRLTGWIPTKLLRAFLRSFDFQQEIAEAAGYNVFPRKFDSPFPEVENINWPRLRARRELPGVELNIPIYLEPDVPKVVPQRAKKKDSTVGAVVNECLRKDIQSRSKRAS